MEPLGTFSDEEFHSLSKMFSDVDADFMLQMHDDDIYFNGCENGLGSENPSSFYVSHEANNKRSFSSSSDTFNTDYNCLYVSQESSHSNGIDNIYFPCTNNEDHQANNVNFRYVMNDTSESMEFNVMDNISTANALVPVFTDDAMGDIQNGKEEPVNDNSRNADCQPLATVTKPHQLKRKSESPEESLSNDSSDDVKKKTRVSRDPRKKKKIMDCKNENDDENKTNGGQAMQSSSPAMSEDDSNASQELSDSKGSAVLNSNGKKRATRGSATDSQSLYARKRRERINERLKILQNIVPNGTKVDISTMLEEAVQYVKFLQLQIKLLSSDDLRMYAPIAYNGMDIGSYQKIFPYL